MSDKKVLVSALLIIIVAVAGFLIYKSGNDSSINPASIRNFEECAKAGNPVMESYPRQCRSASGELFVEAVAKPDPIPPAPNPNPTPGPKPVISAGCYVGGCSGEVCSDQKDIASACIYKPEYGCYKTAGCVRLASGKCGWTQTAELSACLNSFSGQAAVGHVSGHVTIGPNCPVERVGEPCKASPEAYTSREAVVYASNGTTVKERAHLNAEGNYNIAIAPGFYVVQIAPAGIGPGEKKQAAVKSNETTVVNFDIDTGIR